MNETVPPVYNADEAAALLKCKPRWLKDRARKREIPFTMVGGSYGWTPAHLAEIIRQFEQRPQAARSPRAPSLPKQRDAAEPTLRAKTPRRSRVASPSSARPDAA